MNQAQIDDIKQFLEQIIIQHTAGLVSKEDIANMATKDDIANMATKDDIANMATKDDIANMATKDDLRKLERRLTSKIDDLDLKIDTISIALNEDINNHDIRLKKLESQTA